MMSPAAAPFDQLIHHAQLSAECRRLMTDLQPLFISDKPWAESLCCSCDSEDDHDQRLQAKLAQLLPRISELPELQAEPGPEQEILRPYLLALCRRVAELPRTLWQREDLLGPKAQGRPLRRYVMGDQAVRAIGERGQLERNWLKVRFSALTGLGGLEEAGEGHNGTRFAWKTGRRLCGVYKPAWEQMPLESRLSNRLKTLFGGQLSKLPYGPIKQTQAERAAYLYDRFHNVHQIPASMLLKDGACFQLSLYKHLRSKHGLAAGHEMDVRRGDQAEDLLNRLSYLPSELASWQDYCIEDYAIGDLDAAPDNFFLYVDEDETILDVVGIDKGHSYPVKDVSSFALADHHRYLWGRDYRISEFPFLPVQRERMRACAARFDDYWRLIGEDRELEGFCEPRAEELMRLRCRVLGKAADDPAMSPALLSDLRSASQMQDYLA